MGIPAFFGWISQKYRRILRKQMGESVDNLYIDVNGIIHQACQGRDGEYLDDEEEMCRRIVQFLEHLLTLVRVNKLVYLAVDGVAPRAKLNQQRARRFSSAKARLSTDIDFDDMFCEEAMPASEIDAAQKELQEVKASLNLGIFSGDAAFRSGVEEEEEEEAARRAAAEMLASPDEGGADPDALAGFFGDDDNGDAAPSGGVAGSPPQAKEKWDSNAITPGTAFMARVADLLSEWGERQMGVFSVIVSDSNTVGEGEHKFIDFIKEEKARYILEKQRGQGGEGGGPTPSSATPASRMWFDPNDSHAVVSLDADILLLSLSLHLPNVTVIREDRRHEPLTKFEYVSIDALREYLVEEVIGRVSKYAEIFAAEKSSPEGRPSPAGSPTSPEQRVAWTVARRSLHYVEKSIEEAVLACTDPNAEDVRSYLRAPELPRVDPERVVTDVVALLAVCGNDFVPHLPGAYVGQLTGDTLIDVYARLLAGGGSGDFPYLTDRGGSLVLSSFMEVMRQFSRVEDALFRSEAAMTKVLENNFGTEGDHLWRNAYYDSVAGLMPERCVDPESSIRPAKWKTPQRREEFVTKMCKSYLEGVAWVAEYYSKPGTVSWSWFYDFYHAPFASDLARHLRTESLQVPKGSPKPGGPLLGYTGVSLFPSKGSPLQPKQQLLSVLPPSSFHLLPDRYGKGYVDRFSKKYPSTWVLDLTGCRMEYQGVAMMPFLNIDELVKLTADRTPLENAQANFIFTGGTQPEPLAFRAFSRAGVAKLIPAETAEDGEKDRESLSELYAAWPQDATYPPLRALEKPQYLPWAKPAAASAVGVPVKEVRGVNAVTRFADTRVGVVVLLLAGVARGRSVLRGPAVALLALLGVALELMHRVMERRRTVAAIGAAAGIPDLSGRKKKRPEMRSKVSALEFFRPKRCKADWICPRCSCKNWERQTSCFNAACAAVRTESDSLLYLPKSNTWSPTCFSANHVCASAWR